MEEKIQKARDIAAAIAKVTGISSARVDDWNNHGEFTLFARIPTENRSNKPADKEYDLRKVMPKVRKILAGLHYSIYCPKRVYEKPFSGRGKQIFRGYENNLITIDLIL